MIGNTKSNCITGNTKFVIGKNVMNQFIQNDNGDLVSINTNNDLESFKLEHANLMYDINKVFNMNSYIGDEECIEICIEMMRKRGIIEERINYIIPLILYEYSLISEESHYE